MSDMIDDEIRWAVEQVRQVADRLEKLAGIGPFPLYSQRDPEWAGDRLGPDAGGGTVGGLGCAVTDAAMLMTAHGMAITPGELNRLLSQRGGFSAAKQGAPRNQLRWEFIPEVCPALKYYGRRDWSYISADVPEIRRVMVERGPVIAQVDFDPKDRDVDEHYVILLEWLGPDDLAIADPWTGQRVGLVERYWNPTWNATRGKVARIVTGLRFLQARVE